MELVYHSKSGCLFDKNGKALNVACGDIHSKESRIKRVFVGYDGFVDELVRPVKKTISETLKLYFNSITEFTEYLAEAAGKSADIEITEIAKRMGGNAPIMANAMANLGLKVCCCGALGEKKLNSAFSQLNDTIDILSVCDPASCTAFEFNDGKLMFAKLQSLNLLSFDKILSKAGEEKLVHSLHESDLVALVDWSNGLNMTEIWNGTLDLMLKSHASSEKIIFFDLADPFKRESDEIFELCSLIQRFSIHFRVHLGLNLNEAEQLYQFIFKNSGDINEMAVGLANKTGAIIVIHTIDSALLSDGTSCLTAKGRLIYDPVLTTGGGDNFNAGYCYGLLAGITPLECLNFANNCSNYYVQYGKSPTLNELRKAK